jgi:CubicO group peptidase (beta-lactamase class C family)
MSSRNPIRLVHLLALLAFPHAVFSAQDTERHARMQAVEAMFETEDDDALRAFAGEHLAPAYIDSFEGEQALLTHLRQVRSAVQPVGGIGITVEAGRIRLHVESRELESVVAFELEDEAPYRIDLLVLESSGPRERGPVMTWDTLEASLEEAAENGFSGSILALRGGEVVLDRGFGYADPEKRHPVTPDTLFAIGSTPIDFTHGGILKLEELGLLSLNDPLTRWFEDVPEDKRGITLEHLRTGRSGLLDFPGIAGVDENLDLSWIDRAEFLRRVFSSELLFEPGTRERHSHAAWGVLAAVIEVVTGQGYEEFLRESFFEPAGMERTGHYPHAKGFPMSEVAVGLGGNVWGEVNAPPYWGETSWLVLGSGGMVSTPRDLARWRRFLATEDGLWEEGRQRYGLGGVMMGEGGNDRGFINTLGFDGDDWIIVCSNAHVGMNDETARIAMAAARAVESSN